jgi:filamentous hemagglutinin
LSRDTTNANGSVQSTFDAQTVQNNLAFQQGVGQVGMQVVGDIAQYLENQAIDKVRDARTRLANANDAGNVAAAQQAQADLDAANAQVRLWDNDGAARIASHAVVAGVGAGLGGGSVAGAVGGTVAGDLASEAVSNAAGDALGGAILSNAAAGLAGAAAGGTLGGSLGAMSGASGALNADLYNRKLHANEKAAIHKKANGDEAQENKLTRAACFAVKCWAEFSPNSDEWLANYVSPEQAAQLGPEMEWVQSQNTSAGLFDYPTGSDGHRCCGHACH